MVAKVLTPLSVAMVMIISMVVVILIQLLLLIPSSVVMVMTPLKGVMAMTSSVAARMMTF